MRHGLHAGRGDAQRCEQSLGGQGGDPGPAQRRSASPRSPGQHSVTARPASRTRVPSGACRQPAWPVVGFDLDLTLVDSTAGIGATLRAALAAEGSPRSPSDAELHPLIGVPLETTVSIVDPGRGRRPRRPPVSRALPELGVRRRRCCPASWRRSPPCRAQRRPGDSWSRAKFEPAVRAVLRARRPRMRAPTRPSLVVGGLFAGAKGMRLREAGRGRLRRRSPWRTWRRHAWPGPSASASPPGGTGCRRAAGRRGGRRAARAHVLPRVVGRWAALGPASATSRPGPGRRGRRTPRRTRRGRAGRAPPGRRELTRASPTAPARSRGRAGRPGTRLRRRPRAARRGGRRPGAGSGLGHRLSVKCRDAFPASRLG